MLGKIIDGRLVIAGNRVRVGATEITQPKREQLIALGYKEVSYTEKPSYDEEEEKLSEVYTEGDKITVSYEVVALTDEEHNAIIQSKIVAEEGKITARNIRGGFRGDQFALDKINEVENNVAVLRSKLREIKNETELN